MKLKHLLAAAGIVVAAPGFAASTTHTLNVSATVTGNCRFNSAGPSTLTLANNAGAIDPSSTTAATGSVNILFRCTTGTTSTIAADNGLHYSGSSRTVSDGTNAMPYSLSLSGDSQVGTGHGPGNDLTLSVSGSIVATDFQNAPAGGYSDSVTLTITP